MTKYKYLLWAFILIFLACKKEEKLPTYEPLLVETLPISLQGDSIKISGKIVAFSAEAITEFGFLMAQYNTPEIDKSDSVWLIDEKPETGVPYKHFLLNNIDEDITFHVRFFARTAGEIAYGNIVELTGNGLIVPLITGFTPNNGYNGEIVKITGKYFRSGEFMSVWLGDEMIPWISWTDENILVEIPDYTNREELPFKIYMNGYIVESTEKFLLRGPHITGFSPESGGNEAEITLYGEDFSEITWHNTVFLGTAEADILEAAENQLKIKIHTHVIPAGNYPFIINSEGKQSVSEKTFEVTSPWQPDSQLPLEDGLAAPVALINENKIVLATGTTDWLSTAGYSQYVFEYDVNTHSWTQKSDFPGERRSYAAGFVLNGKGYIGTGNGYYSYFGLNDFWEYDFQNDEWTQKNDFPGSKRSGVIAFAYNGNGYFLMGSKNIDFWKYNTADDTWEEMPAFEGHKRNGANHVIIGDELYIVGGGDPNNPFDADIWKFNFTTQQWSFVNYLEDHPMKMFRHNNRTFMLERTTNQVFGVNQTILYEFDVEQSIKTVQYEIFPGTDRSYSSFSAVINGILYFGVGGTGGYGQCLNDIWTYPLNNN